MQTIQHPVRIGQATDKGNVRTNNEDAFGWFSVPAGELILVADGIGGHVGGEVASQCAIKAFSEAMREATGNPAQDLTNALLYADRCVKELGEKDARLRGCGTTIVALLITPTSAWHIHAGDSRVYKLSNGKLRQLGRDHSSVQDMLAAGLITKEQAKYAPKNVITQSLGGNVNPGYCKPEQVAYCRGDKFLLCTDGLWGMVNDDKIESLLNASPHVRDNVESLLQAALDAGGKDNVTLQVVECLNGREAPLDFQQPVGKKSFRLSNILAIIGCIAILMASAGLVYKLFFPGSQNEKQANINVSEQGEQQRDKSKGKARDSQSGPQSTSIKEKNKDQNNKDGGTLEKPLGELNNTDSGKPAQPAAPLVSGDSVPGTPPVANNPAQSDSEPGMIEKEMPGRKFENGQNREGIQKNGNGGGISGTEKEQEGKEAITTPQRNNTEPGTGQEKPNIGQQTNRNNIQQGKKSGTVRQVATNQPVKVAGRTAQKAKNAPVNKSVSSKKGNTAANGKKGQKRNPAQQKQNR